MTRGLERTALLLATAPFVVPPALRLAGWLLGAALPIVLVLAYVVHRARLRRQLELERIRTRIATDLHDDIGSNLSKVAILTEVARRQLRGGDLAAADPLLESIADTARGLVDSMAEIVWSVNPSHDHARDLVQRMRRFASDTLASRGIRPRFDGPADGRDRRLDVELRREVYLIFKEAVSNAARHSGASEVAIRLRLDDGALELTIRDDGRGFATARDGEGDGLGSMRARAARLRGRCTVASERGRGTSVDVVVPLGRVRWARRSTA